MLTYLHIKGKRKKMYTTLTPFSGTGFHAHTIHFVQSMLASVRSSFPLIGVQSCGLFFLFGVKCASEKLQETRKLVKKRTYISGESSLATFIATSLSKGEAPSPTQTCENILDASKLSNIFL